MTSIEEIYIYNTEATAVRTRDWAAGSAIATKTPTWIFENNVWVLEKLMVSPSMTKMFDETLVNTMDHAVKFPKLVNEIRVKWQNNVFECFNNGPGIHLDTHKVSGIPVPQMIFGQLYQGSNGGIRNENSIVGGANGIGCKICNALSNYFKLNLVTNGQRYIQTWRDGMQIVENPEISQTNEKDNVTICYQPNLTLFPEINLVDTEKWITQRCLLTLLYFEYICGSKVKFYFNDNLLNTSIFTKTNITLTFPHKTLKNMVIYVHEMEHKHGSQNYISLINGIYASGSHVNIIEKSITEEFTKICTTLVGEKGKTLDIDTRKLKRSLFYVIVCQSGKINWSGQRKDVAILAKDQLRSWTINWNNATFQLFLKRIAIETVQAPQKKREKLNISFEKYRPVSARAINPQLMLVEGDSAMSIVVSGISENELLKKNTGILSVNGVPMNARRESKLVGNRMIPNKKLNQNKFFSTLLHVTGLTIGKIYTKQNLKELKYCCVIGCVDQDLDGVGNIFGLLLNLFDCLWPELLNLNYVKRFNTPIIRVYSKQQKIVNEFYSEANFNIWEKEQINGTGNYNIKYYKGLGTHGSKETISMFKDFNKHLIVYESNLERVKMLTQFNDSDWFHKYFGDDPNERKAILSAINPIYDNDYLQIQEKQNLTNLIGCSEHLRYETEIYQRDNIDRKLDSAIDGQNQSGRKILSGCFKAFKKQSSYKIAQLAGAIANTENYHHGEASLADSITGRGFVAVGGKQVPIIIPQSNFGTRLKGGSDASQPRYIYGKLNPIMNLLYSSEDYYLLDFNFSEGNRGEPRYYMPILPPILEHNVIPGHGWKYETWGRDIIDVANNVRKLILDSPRIIEPTSLYYPIFFIGKKYNVNIREDENSANLLIYNLKNMSVCIDNWKGKIVCDGSREYSEGVYSVSKNKITITELPLRVWTFPYLEKLKENPDILEIENESGATNISIILTCNQNIIDDPINSLNLRKCMTSHINMIGSKGEVLEFTDYRSVIFYWFKFRKEFYNKRVVRNLRILTQQILYQQNLIRYIATFKVDLKETESKLIERIELANYIKFNSANVISPNFEDVEKTIVVSFDYLLNVRDRDRTKEATLARETKVNKLIADKENYVKLSSEGNFIGAQIWLNEIDEIITNVTKGKQNNWGM